MSNKPVMKFRAKGVSVTVWRGKGNNLNATVGNQYRDKVTGEWRETTGFFLSDLRLLADQVRAAIDYMHEQDGNRQVGGRPISDDFSAPVPQKKQEPVSKEVTFDNDDIPF